ncbi:hypothetical protein [Streptomyces sp. SID10815]|uniref:hypothetical protein n=1 Tax=Streptomyces sp. SID10815 TaxID=2706027 RepID=UPI0031B9F562
MRLRRFVRLRVRLLVLPRYLVRLRVRRYAVRARGLRVVRLRLRGRLRRVRLCLRLRRVGLRLSWVVRLRLRGVGLLLRLLLRGLGAGRPRGLVAEQGAARADGPPVVILGAAVSGRLGHDGHGAGLLDALLRVVDGAFGDGPLVG